MTFFSRFFTVCTVKPVNKCHSREREHVVFIDKWSLFGGYFVLSNQGRVNEVWPFLQGGLYWEVALNTGLIVCLTVKVNDRIYYHN